MSPDNLDRDKMYSAGADDLDSDDDLELEPPDAEVLAAAERRAAEAINAHRASIDVNEVYRDFDANRDTEIVEEWVARWKNFHFQFQIKHLLLLTAVVAILLALHQWIPMRTMFIVGIMLAVAGVSLYLKLEENKRQEAADRRRRKMYAERRAQQARQSGQPVEAVEHEEEPAPPNLPAAPRSPAATLHDLRFQFSMSQLLVAITVAALLLGLSGAVGGLAGLATICGLLALGGLIVPLLGFQPSGVVVFGWWIVLALYVVLSISARIWTSLHGG